MCLTAWGSHARIPCMRTASSRRTSPAASTHWRTASSIVAFLFSRGSCPWSLTCHVLKTTFNEHCLNPATFGTIFHLIDIIFWLKFSVTINFKAFSLGSTDFSRTKWSHGRYSQEEERFLFKLQAATTHHDYISAAFVEKCFREWSPLVLWSHFWISITDTERQTCTFKHYWGVPSNVRRSLQLKSPC